MMRRVILLLSTARSKRPTRSATFPTPSGRANARPSRSHRRSSRHVAQARTEPRPRTRREHHRSLHPRRDRRRLHRLQRVQVGHLPAPGCRKTSAAHEDRHSADCRRRRALCGRKGTRRRGSPFRRIEIEPVDTAEADEEARKFGTANVDYIYEQPAEELFAGLIPQYVFSMLYHAMTESVAAEHAPA